MCNVDSSCLRTDNFAILLLLQKLSEVPEPTGNAGSFTISGKLLPSYITLQTAEKILFVGEAVHMFSSQRQMASSSRDVG